MKKIFFILSIIFFSYSLFAQGSQSTVQQSSPFSQAKFVPDISFITDFSYNHRTVKNETFNTLHIPGFCNHHRDEHNHHHGVSTNGFNFNYAELSLYSIVDPYFDLFATFHGNTDHVALEEAYVTTRALPHGLQLKAGKFLSSFGRMNEQHTHYFDFSDRPFILTSFLGEEGLNDIGVRLTYLPPTPFYLLVGAELFAGCSTASFQTSELNDPFGTFHIHEIESPNLGVGYIKTSFDVNEATFLFGTSLAYGTTRIDEDFSDVSVNEGSATDATTSIFGLDGTMKYALDAIRTISFQTELLYRFTDGKLYTRDTLTTQKNTLKKNQAGFYTQLVFKTDTRWRIGLRYEQVLLNDIFINSAKSDLPSSFSRYSAMLEYNTTEFARLRFQLTHDRSRYEHFNNTFTLKPFTEVSLQLNVTIGAHGAHQF